MATPSEEIQWPQAASELKFIKRLGVGYFGEAWECKCRNGAVGKSFAVKKVPLSILTRNKLVSQMGREIEIMRSLRHHRIVEFHFEFRDTSYIYLGMEYVEGGSMFTPLSRAGKFSLQKSAQYFYEACEGLEYLHALPDPVVHRDIKPENILLDKGGHVKLADFGWSKIMEGASLCTTFCGTPDYLAPEMIKGEGHDTSLDMWEMGVLLYEMSIGKSPFGSQSQEETCKKILKVALRFPAAHNGDCRDLIKSLCRFRKEERLTAAGAKRHLFVRNFHQTAEVALTAFVTTTGSASSQISITNMAGEEIQAFEMALSSTFEDLKAMLIQQAPDLHGRFKLLLPNGVDLMRLQSSYPTSKLAELDASTICLHEEGNPRPEVVVRRLQRDIVLLEEQMSQILQAKKATEQQLYAVLEESEQAHKDLHQEQKALSKVKKEVAAVKAREKQQDLELMELKEKINALSADSGPARQRS